MASLFLLAFLIPVCFGFTPTKLSYSELLESTASTQVKLLSGLEEVGLISITNIPDYGLLREEVLTLLAGCLQANEDSSLKMNLPDGTKRYTLGLASENGEEIDYSGPDLDSATCSRFHSKQETFRSIVNDVTEKIVNLLDLSLGLDDGTRKLLLDTKSYNVASTLKEIVGEGLHLEHFHLYEKETQVKSKWGDRLTRKLHTDHGLFIILSPALMIEGDTEGHGFFIQLQNGDVVQPDFGKERAELVMMIGDGFRQWIEPKLGRSLRSTPHAVQMPFSHSGLSTRSWYGKMILPKSSMYLEPQEMTLREMRRKMMSHDVTDREDLRHSACSPGLIISERFLDECPQGTISCWNTCLDSTGCDPTTEDVECGRIVNETFSPCPEGVHGPDCLPRCLLKDEPTETGTQLGNGFCNGFPVSMYMEGFQGISSAEQGCLVFLFEELQLDSGVKYIGASVATFLIGVFTEFVVSVRRKVAKANTKTGYLNIAKTMLYALQITFGYIAMLIAMTYSLLLFVMIVAGLAAGHRIFNFNLIPGENADVCCPTVEGKRDV